MASITRVETNTNAKIEEKPLPSINKSDEKVQTVFKKKKKEIDSDDELKELTGQKKTPIFSRKGSVSVLSMTIPCKDQNIKGSTLIQIVHKKVTCWYDEAIDLACEYEKDIGRTVIDPPETNSNILVVDAARDWFMSLGGWKGMMPKEEVPDYFFYQYGIKKPVVKFVGVKVFNGATFPLKNHRLHIPKNFSIASFDVTTAWKKRYNKWTSYHKTDLSYSQILKAIDHIKKTFKVTDAQIASFQMHALSYHHSSSSWFEKIASKNRTEIETFLNYLNALMFGVEASGLNAALITSLMTLDLIEEGKLDYKTAFVANSDGGVYPYACFGNNKGSYNQREKTISQDTTVSMKSYRKNPSLSPVAVKEATLIKTWLDHHGVTSKKLSNSDQRKLIEKAIKELIDYNYSPWLDRDYTLKKFKK